MTNAQRLRAMLDATEHSVGERSGHLSALGVSHGMLSDSDVIEMLCRGESLLISRSRAESILMELESND